MLRHIMQSIFWLSGAATREHGRLETLEAAPLSQKCIGLNRLDAARYGY